MPRGGPRPGAGRKKVVKAVPVSEIAVSVAPAGVKPAGAPETWPFGTVDPATDAPALGKMTPLEFLMGLVQNEEADVKVRLQAAALAAPYVHAKPAPGGKKDEKNKAAKTAASGKFAAAAPPLRVVGR